MPYPSTERDLLAIALALLDDPRKLTAAERQSVVGIRPCIDQAVIGLVRRQILVGGDPLGDALCAIRSNRERRGRGQTFTPAAIIDAMLARAQDEARERGAFGRIVDPGAGSGRFLARAGRLFPATVLVGIELDPVCAVLLRATVTALGFASRCQILVDDYCDLQELLPNQGRTLFVGNPPYVRHHGLTEASKAWYARAAADLDVPRASKLAGLHLHFFLQTGLLARPGDFGLFVTAAEWMETNYGKTLRELLCGRLGGTSLHVVDAKAEPFPGTLTTAVVTAFRPGETPGAIRLQVVDSVSALGRLEGGQAVPTKVLASASRWNCETTPEPRIANGIRVGELFRVSRGQVTGCNAAWIAGDHAKELPQRFLIPCVTAAEEIFAARANDGLLETSRLKRVVSLPKNLSVLAAEERQAVRRFLDWAKKLGADQSYVARHRHPWWVVPIREPAPIICTYMARRPAAFVRNLAGAGLLNIAHGLYPRVSLSPEELDEICDALNRAVCLSDGRTYAGGLVKFEPRAVEELLIDWTPRRQAANI